MNNTNLFSSPFFLVCNQTGSKCKGHKGLQILDHRSVAVEEIKKVTITMACYVWSPFVRKF